MELDLVPVKISRSQKERLENLHYPTVVWRMKSLLEKTQPARHDFDAAENLRGDTKGRPGGV